MGGAGREIYDDRGLFGLVKMESEIMMGGEDEAG